ncbi:MAG: transcription termination/antitermination protein NusG [Candidatus Krumholzibacteriia bacterium]
MNDERPEEENGPGTAGAADASADEAAPDADDGDALFFDLPEEDEPEAEDAAPEAAPAPAVADQEDDLLAAVPLELSADERRQIERKGQMRWFVIHANTGHENKVKRNIEMAVKSNHMEEFFGEVLVATQEVTEMKNGKRSTVKRKFFPSYILVEMVMDKETHHFINSIPGVTRFIGGTPLKPEPISRDEVDRILGRISAPEEARETLEIPYLVGDSVQVMDGPFTEWVGVINEINHDKGKLKVMISIFGSETPVELDFLQVKPV